MVYRLFEEIVQFQSSPQLQPQIAGPELSRPFQAHPIHQHARDLRIVRRRLHMRRKQFQLLRFGVFVKDLDCLQPARTIRAVQLTQMAKRFLPRTIRRAHRLHQRPIGVLLSIFAPTVRPQNILARSCHETGPGTIG